MVIVRYLLDTNVCIHLLRSNAPSVIIRFADVGAAACGVSEITIAELRVGAESSQRPEYQHGLIDQLSAVLATLPIAPAIRLFARERVRLQRSGQPVDGFDLLIGATALAGGMVMVTNNTKHFNRIQGLTLEDWTQAPESEEKTI